MSTVTGTLVHLRCLRALEGGSGLGSVLILLPEDMTGPEHFLELKMIILARKR